MKVLIAKEHGFCNGVKRALARLDHAIAENPGRAVYSIGEIIHNAQVIRAYEGKGVRTVSSIWEAGGGLGVVRAHGLPSSLIEEARAKGLEIIDATCPYVRLISRIIKKELDSGSQIFLLGEPGHPEVIAATADFSPNVTVLDHASFDPKTFEWPKGNVVLLSQTTMSEETFLAVTGEFIRHCHRVIVCNTICQSTRVRQSSALETAGKVQAMVVIGGNNSSNTRRLTELCAQVVPTKQIENAAGLAPDFFKGMSVVGVTAGASTPEYLVDEVVEYLKRL
jgi:(E)-4-hydroxy-3-methyl-but-2-enyl pyrophosphate reductase